MLSWIPDAWFPAVTSAAVATAVSVLLCRHHMARLERNIQYRFERRMDNIRRDMRLGMRPFGADVDAGEPHASSLERTPII